jgi:hypothetical protein
MLPAAPPANILRHLLGRTACPGFHAHLSLHDGDDKPEILRYPISLICPVGIDAERSSQDDFEYQRSLAARGAFIEHDMLGMDYFIAVQRVQCPGDDASAAGILRLVEAEFGDRVLLSQDVFIRMMRTRHRGNGYSFVLRHFLPRPVRHGLDPEATAALIHENPGRVFCDAHPTHSVPEHPGWYGDQSGLI